METLLTFCAILFGLILLTVIAIDVNLSIIRYHDFSGMQWKTIGKLTLGFVTVLVIESIIYIALNN
jgi:hypothetical protein